MRWSACPSVPISVVQSVIPITAALIIVAEITYLIDIVTSTEPPAALGARRRPALTRRGPQPMTIMLLLFGAVLALVLANVPIAVSLGIVALIAMVGSHGVASLPNLALVTYNGATNFPLLAIPLFILAGAIMNASGISHRLIAVASALFGWIRGGLAQVSVGASMFFAEISGSAVADIAALGSILIPAMKAKGYPAPLAAAVMSSSATLAVIIPPSIPMILYAVMAETSVVQLFVAGIVPGILGGLGLMGVAYWLARRYDLPREEAFSGPASAARRARRCGRSCCR